MSNYDIDGFENISQNPDIIDFLKPEQIKGIYYNCGRKILRDKDGNTIKDKFRKTNDSWGHLVLNSETGEFHLLPQQKAYTQTLELDDNLGAKLYKINYKGTVALPDGNKYNDYSIGVKQAETPLTVEQMTLYNK
jgi:hypothetical protein